MIDNEVSSLFENPHQYDLQNRHLIDDIYFYLDWAKQTKGKVLELACGTGRITIPIAKKNIEIWGIDLFKNMLNKAKEKMAKEGLNIPFYQCDIRNFNLNEKFDLIILPFNSIAYLKDLKSVEECLGRIKEHLSPEGLFIFDIFNPDLNLIANNEQKEINIDQYRDRKNDELVTITGTSSYDNATQIRKLTWNFKTDSKEYSHHLDTKVYFPQELKILLKYNGFSVLKKFGCFDESLFESDSPLQIFVCQLKKSK